MFMALQKGSQTISLLILQTRFEQSQCWRHQ